ncbi:MAG: histidine triad nucleotide-binding protein [Terriglobia bacterium]|jgi:histidine triad (HIT) family protein
MTDATMNCLFCKIARREAPAKYVHEDESAVAFEDIRPRAPTHLVVIPRKHLESLNAMGAEDEPVIGHLHSIAAALAHQRGLDQTGYRVVINTGRNAGQSVFHVHLHLLGGRPMMWPPG